jgi:hypothetical protein
MIERLFLPNRTAPVEQLVEKVSGATLDKPHNLWQAHQPSLSIPQSGE